MMDKGPKKQADLQSILSTHREKMSAAEPGEAVGEVAFAAPFPPLRRFGGGGILAPLSDPHTLSTAHRLREAVILQAQTTQGNRHVARAISQSRPPVHRPGLFIQPGAAPGKLHGTAQRVPKSEDELEGKEPRYSYSTNCGWIDWGHTNPTFAKDLLDAVKKASRVMYQREAPLRTVLYDRPALIYQDACDLKYEPKEVRESKTDEPVVTKIERSSGIVEFRLGGFAVGSTDASKFAATIRDIAIISDKLEKQTGWPHTIIIHGFTDCIDTKKKNAGLRQKRANSVNKLLSSQGKYAALAQASAAYEFMADNITRAGRKMNRGVMIELIPEMEPKHEQFFTPVMEAKVMGRQLTAAFSQLELQRSLDPDEIERVSLWIFMNLSKFFELEQQWTERIGRSSFSEEDLPSNLIGFYMAAMGVKQTSVRSIVGPICDVWNPKWTKEIYKGYRFQKNETFYPPFSHWPGTWPADFSAINPLEPGKGMYELLGYRLKAAFGFYICDEHGKCYED